MNLQIKNEESFTLVTLDETRLDASIAADFKKQMEEIIDAGNNEIILDISALNFMDSSSLGAMVAVLKKIGTQGKLIISGASGVVLDLFKLTRMDQIFILEKTVDQAKEQFETLSA
ncbi:MAG: STAS domain-containing protein [Thiotrichaceae bacterium]|nr:STAS domain-containing protein [Thiotrichaceae bacterium]